MIFQSLLLLGSSASAIWRKNTMQVSETTLFIIQTLQKQFVHLLCYAVEAVEAVNPRHMMSSCLCGFAKKQIKILVCEAFFM